MLPQDVVRARDFKNSNKVVQRIVILEFRTGQKTYLKAEFLPNLSCLVWSPSVILNLATASGFIHVWISSMLPAVWTFLLDGVVNT